MEEKSNQTAEVVAETNKSNPETLAATPTIIPEAAKTETIRSESLTTPENDRKLRRSERILSFLNRRQAYDFINISDFLKSFYPLVKPPQKPGWMDQGNMRNLKQELSRMLERGEIVFSNTNYARLGENQHDSEGKRFHLHLGDLRVEARLP